jgi:hypothetical protein
LQMSLSVTALQTQTYIECLSRPGGDGTAFKVGLS